MWLLLVLTASQQALLGLFLFYLPGMERKGVFFGKLTRETAAMPELIAHWRRTVILVTLGCLSGSLLGGLLVIHSPGISLLGMILWIGFDFLQGLALAVVWLVMRHRFQPLHPEPPDMNVRRARLRRPPEPARNLRRFLIMVPLLAIVLSLVYLCLRWNEIPQRFPVHWGVHGNVDNWGSRSVRKLSLLPGMCLIIWAFFFWMLKLDPVGFMSPRRRFGFELLIIGSMWMILLPLCLISALLPFGDSNSIIIYGLSIILAPAATAALLVPLWLKISPRFATDAPPTPAEINRLDPRYWRSGFYFNPDDPALWVEKRYGAGATLNVGLWKGKAIIAGYFLFLFFLVLWPLLMA